MFKIATVSDWWDLTLNPQYAFLRKRNSYLKAIGYAFVIQNILSHKPQRILEFGHATSPIFSLFGSDIEMWGVDDEVDYISSDKIDQFRKQHENESNAKFISGKLGEVTQIPEKYFDIVYSVSVVEHIPSDNLNKVFEEVFRILKPGGLSIGSYDIIYGKLDKQVYTAHLKSGLKWMDPKQKPILDWDAKNICFEDGRHIIQYYMYGLPEEKRAKHYIGNCVTVLMKAYKPDNE